MGYRIKTVAELTGIPRNTILAWERRHDLLSPSRAENGYREFTEDDVRVLRRVKVLIDEGYRIGEAVRLLREVDGGPGRETLLGDGVDPVAARARARLLERLLDLDRAGADAERAGLALLSFRRQLELVFEPLRLDLAALRAQGEVGLARARFVEGFLREQLIGIFHQLAAGPEGGPRAACAGARGQREELDLLSVAVRLALGGYHVLYLGPDLPGGELVEVARQRPTRLACVSFAREPEAASCELRALRAALDPGTALVALGAAALGEGPLPPGLALCPDPAGLDVALEALGMKARW